MTRVSNTAYKSITAEQTLLEAAMFLQTLEDNVLFNTSEPKASKVNVQINTDDKTATISAILPIIFEANPIGGTIIYADEYLATPNNQPLDGPP